MEKPTIKKSIDIKAPKQRVWQVLVEAPDRDVWASDFQAGSHVEGDYVADGLITFLDGSNAGIRGKVAEIKPAEFVHIKYIADIVDGIETPFAADADWSGTSDTYRLSEENGVTTLTVATQVPSDEEVREFEPMWVDALNTIKKLAERR